MAALNEIESFLNDFFTKLSIWGIFVRDDRNKNAQTLLDLEITPADRISIIKKLVATDYSEGPVTDTLLKGSDMWIFGKKVKGLEIYIKITMGHTGSKVMCLSFHIAEYPMKYPHKK